MYALCVSGAVNTQGFVWKVFMRYIYKFSFIHSFILQHASWFHKCSLFNIVYFFYIMTYIIFLVYKHC